MVDLNSINSREDFKISLIEKALKNPAYLKDLVQNPQTVLVRELGPEQANGLSMQIRP
ncbi:MAG: hypothetical protein JWP00_2340 [Chloroflexi bacterium]|nr:hypothetical protein [Chloroflexota bacterium]